MLLLPLLCYDWRAATRETASAVTRATASAATRETASAATRETASAATTCSLLCCDKRQVPWRCTAKRGSCVRDADKLPTTVAHKTLANHSTVTCRNDTCSRMTQSDDTMPKRTRPCRLLLPAGCSLLLQAACQRAGAFRRSPCRYHTPAHPPCI